ncbi:DJ-1/PfpI family protein [Halomicrococcus sp. NG-SE-24]|uniref:DJ-1/PfpI family protein n=1 Tax=Halomicrococcus sp. NG-SE-24 TaxID=3436928 RepID=UPI003D959B9A
MKVAILLYEGFDELDAIGPFEVLKNAANAGADCRTSLCTLDDRERVAASHGLGVEVDAHLDDLSPDLLVVPGGGWNDRNEAGAWTEAEHGAVPDAVAAASEAGTTVASVCTGAMLLARAGLLDGRPATTHASALDDLRATDAEVVDARVVDDGDVLTAGGVTSGLDLALHLVERKFGAETATQVREEMEYEPRGEVYR